MGVLLMLLSLGGVIAAVVLAVISLITKKRWLLKFTLIAAAVWFASYAVLLVGFSLASQEKDLGVNQAKEYCGFYLDCHMHTMVIGVRTSKTVSDQTANGTFY